MFNWPLNSLLSYTLLKFLKSQESVWLGRGLADNQLANVTATKVAALSPLGFRLVLVAQFVKKK